MTSTQYTPGSRDATAIATVRATGAGRRIADIDELCVPSLAAHCEPVPRQK